MPELRGGARSLAEVAPREMKKCLLDSLGTAARARRRVLLAGDVVADTSKTKRSIGFSS